MKFTFMVQTSEIVINKYYKFISNVIQLPLQIEIELLLLLLFFFLLLFFTLTIFVPIYFLS